MSSQPEHPLDGTEPLFENSEIEKRLTASFGDVSATGVRVDIRDQGAIENGFSILPAIVDAIQADDGSFQIKGAEAHQTVHLERLRNRPARSDRVR